MNNITTKQNEKLQLQRLSAQRELYSSAKKVYRIQLLLNIVAPIVLSSISLFYDPFTPYAAAIGFFTIFFDVLILDRMTKKRKEKAAKIQELFDCDVLELPMSPLKTATDVGVEEILEHYHAHKKVESNIEKIRDWYPQAISNVPIHIARLVCQRTNCWWDARLRQRYINGIIIIGIIFILFVTTVGIIKEISLLKCFLLANTVAPLFQFAIKQFYDNRDSKSRLKELIAYIEEVWDEAKSGKAAVEITEKSRRVQDEIFAHRSQNPLIPD
ncbi:MAG: S-4TM family putative pore-forming effector, partial [Bacteroidia bacterium]